MKSLRGLVDRGIKAMLIVLGRTNHGKVGESREGTQNPGEYLGNPEEKPKGGPRVGDQ